MNSREIVLEMLLLILEKNQFSHVVIRQVLDKYSFLEKTDRSFIKLLTQGVVEEKIKIDYVINHYSKVETNKMKPVIRTILRMGVYQILFMDKVPDSAACNESVKLANKKGFSNLKGFVNGVLRTISRQKLEITYPRKEEHVVDYFSVQFSMPKWIVEKLLREYGSDQLEIILQGLIEKRPITIRIDENLSKDEKNQLLNQIKEHGIEAIQDENLEYAYCLEQVDRIMELPGFSSGQWMIQDLGAMYVTECAHIKQHDAVLDLCAAPGGKTLHAATKLNGTGRISARDKSQEKVALIQENIARTKYHNIDVKVFDATVVDEAWIQNADVVICDLPCSGIGVIGRKPDIKYRLTENSIQDIVTLQRRILECAAQYVKPGGKLVYSTCTILKEENEENREWFVNKPQFELIEEKKLLPGIHGTDGFYMACFQRIEDMSGKS